MDVYDTSIYFLIFAHSWKNGSGQNIDEYFIPLIYGWKLLWAHGVVIWDVLLRQNFYMWVALLWTINDFLTYEILSRWSSHGRFVCPYLYGKNKSFSSATFLQTFLVANHLCRWQRQQFLTNRVEKNGLPPILIGEEIKLRVLHC